MQVSAHLLAADGGLPNNPRLPLLLYRGAVALHGDDPAALFESLFERHGWGGSWRDGLFPFHHFHSSAHEVLGIFSGQLRAQFGGPSGLEVEVTAGDVVVVPAGVAHCRVAVRGDLGVVGAYPLGQHPDLCEADSSDGTRHRARIDTVPLPGADPVLGADGPLFAHWCAMPAGR